MLITLRMIDLQKKPISRIWKYRGRIKWTACQEPGLPEDQLWLQWDRPCVRGANGSTYPPSLMGRVYGLFLLSKGLFIL